MFPKTKFNVKMRFATLVAALLPIGSVLATIHTIKVGENDTLTYDPPSVNATVGDQLVFQFVALNHTITQSTFAAPCSNFTFPNGTTGVDSGFQFVAKNATDFPTFTMTVMNTSAPLWFYCRQTGHCEKGMVFAVNPTASKSFEAFQAAAMKTTTNTTSSGTSGSSGSSGSGTATDSASTSTSTSTKANGAAALEVRNVVTLLGAAGMVAGLLL